MRLSTTTSIMAVNSDGSPLVPVNECIKICNSYGYRSFDINFRFAKQYPDYFLVLDDWQKHVDDIRNEAEKLDVSFSQCHIPYYDPVSENDDFLYDLEKNEFFEKMCMRAFIAAKMLGVKWAVVHPLTVKNNNWESDESIKLNQEKLNHFVDFCVKNDMGMAIENMADFYSSTIKRRYAAHYDDLIELVDSFKSSHVGVCWDFGHANIMGFNQVRALEKIGSRLNATHVNDNFGIDDAHLLPFSGNIDWHPIMKVLKKINYDGDFTYETHGAVDHMPAAFRIEVIKLSYKIGKYLLSLM
jgi:L-ribulose-5-phosphate 3-epimerase